MNSNEKIKYRNSKKWKDFRRKLLVSCNYTCQICGIQKRGKKSRYLQIHHINPESYGEESEDDVVVICSADHELIEKLLRRKEFDIDEFCAKLKEIYLKSKNDKDSVAS